MMLTKGPRFQSANLSKKPQDAACHKHGVIKRPRSN
jgi:hypothetical protein